MGPLVIGGVGGSGTRVVAEIVQKTGTFIGTDLNAALDNLWFTLLFKRPAWLTRASDTDVDAALAIFEKAMIGREPWSAAECSALFDVARDISENGHDHLGRGRGEWPFVRMARMIDRTAPPMHGYRGWGWKEPNAHVYLHHLAARWTDLRFVLVVRHGLDMAFSSNHAQLHNWGPSIGVSAADAMPLPRILLRYWLAANSRAIAAGTRLLGARFVVVDYDALCLDPAKHVPALLERLAVTTDISIDDLVDVPRPSPSTGRYREHDLSHFTADDLDGVHRLGYSV